MLGNGDGTFQPPASYFVGASPDTITAGDVSGDGKADLVVTVNNGVSGGGSVSVLYGNGDGSFRYPVNYGTGGPASTVSGDFNGDGAMDMAVTNLGSTNISPRNVSILLGATGTTAQTITFGPLSNVAVGTIPFTVSATASSGLTVGFTSTTPAVCTVSGSTVTVLISGGCSITAIQPGNATYAAAAATQSFTVLFSDVAPGDYDYAAVNAMAQHGITSGCGSNGFCPNASVTRDEMAIFIVRAIYGSDNFTYTTTPYFADVTSGTFGFKWIQKLKDLGITSGCTATTYCPGEVVTRDQMAVFIIRARLGVSIAGPGPTFTYPSTPFFTDATAASEFAFPWIQRMKLDGITSGCTAATYCPTDPVTRGEMAIFIMRGAFNQFLPAGTPVISQISPATLAVGTSGTFTVTGVNTNFVQGTTSISPIPGVTIGAVTVTSATSLTVQLTAASNAVAQPCSLLAITGSEQDVLPNGLVLQ